MKLRFLAFVEAEVARIEVRLESERAGTGSRFAHEYLAVLEMLSVNPRFYPRVEDPLAGREIRQALILRATYRVVYEIDGLGVLVIGVLHTHRRPGAWHAALRTD